MNLIKGFVNIHSYVNNTQGQVAPLGELSTWSETYSRGKGEYSDPAYNNLKLTTFKSIKISDKTHYVLPALQVKHILDVVSTCLNYSTDHIQPFDSNDFRNTVVSAHNDKIAGLNFGPFVSNGPVAMPQWMSWVDLATTNDEIKIWLSDASFRDQYDEYEIEVIPPVTDLNVLFGFYAPAAAAIAANTVATIYERIDAIKNGNPETFIRILPFDYSNSTNPTQRIVTNWSVVIYGKAGDHIDAIKEAITAYVLAHSTRSIADWETILPELFRRTEFIMVPLWHKKSIPNLTDLSALYSSIIKFTEIKAFLETMYPITVYPSNYIADNLSIMPYDYKGISLAVFPGITNILGRRSLVELFPDYIAVPSTSLDFARMSIKTSEFAILLGKLLVAAESTSVYASLPNNFRRITRNGKLYISTVYDNINYMVATASNTDFTS
jgi:hypothetical protein